MIISSYKRSKSKGKCAAGIYGLPTRVIEHKLTKEELNRKFPDGYIEHTE